MSQLTRRDFLELGVKISALMGLSSSAVPALAKAMESLSQGNPPVIWLQGLSCSGCSVSLLNSDAPGPAEILTQYISLLFHSTLSAASGEVAMEVLRQTIQKGGYFLAVEGSMPLKMPSACRMGDRTILDWVTQAAQAAKAVLAVGACAAFGGIPAAENNPTGAVSVPDFLKHQGISTPFIRLPGCPCHPEWLVGTLIHVLSFGLPPLDDLNRPTMFYSRLIHDQCPRFADYEREHFAATFSEEGCLFKLGCLGPQTHADCTLRYWNSRMNTCIRAGAPCIGCASETFAGRQDFPFYTKNAAKISKAS